MKATATLPASTADGFIDRLVDNHGCQKIAASEIDEFAKAPGDSILLLTHDPARVPETLDVLVVLPEVLRPFAGRFRCAVLDAEQSQAVKARFGITRWPALVFQRAGEYVGVIEGMRDWTEFVAEVGSMLDRPTGRAPSVGIPVANASASGCH